MTGIRTTCPYCGVGCGVVATRTAKGGIEIHGDADHPANFGRLCSKGSALGETLGDDGRLLHPSVNGTRVDWDSALATVASGFSDIIAKHGPESVAFYVSGQLLTEDYYVANKLMKGFIGTANIDTNSRLCMSSAVAAHKRAFGEDLVPVSYEDLDVADLVVLVGSNAAWCHPVLFQRVLAAKEKRPDMKLVVIDPRRTPTCEFADLHLPVLAGTDVWLFNGLLSWLHRHGLSNQSYLDRNTSGLDAALAVADATAGDISTVAQRCGLDEGQLSEFFDLFANRVRVVTMFSQGVNQSSAGTDKANSIINCHLLTGRLGRAGMGPFSVTGQPNAMGGREVGGMANMLAAHMDLDNAAHRETVQQFWRSPRIAQKQGLKAVDLFEAIHAGKVKAVWIMATNPVVSLPDADRVREALRLCELVVVSDCIAGTDTNALAHILLPASAWGEKEGTVTNSERRISRQRAFVPAPGDARPDWWIISQIARRMGYEAAFQYASAHDIFVEHAALSGEGADGSRAFDISAWAQATRSEYDGLQPFRWPASKRSEGSVPAPLNHFYHADGRAHFIATTPRLPVNRTDQDFPLVLNTGRIRDQWHTMTRSARAPRLTTHTSESYVDLHRDDANRLGLREGSLAQVTTRWGTVVVRVRCSGEMSMGMIFVPIHWNDQFCSHGRVGALVNSVVDPVSGEPEFKHTPVRVEPYAAKWHGFALTRTPIDKANAEWWTQSRGTEFVRTELAGRQPLADSHDWALRLLGAAGQDERVEYRDDSTGVYRLAVIAGGRLQSVVFVGSGPELPDRGWLASLFRKKKLSVADRDMLLMGESAHPGMDQGPIVCSCFGVTRGSIVAAIARHSMTTPQEVGRALRAGTNCGSCAAEIKVLLAAPR